MLLGTGFLTGCVKPPICSAAICDATHEARDAHAEALLADGGDASVITGANLIALLDAGCGG
jgi:hypothetical protein